MIKGASVEMPMPVERTPPTSSRCGALGCSSQYGPVLLGQRSLPPPTPCRLPPQGPTVPPPRPGPSRWGSGNLAHRHQNPTPTQGAVRLPREDAWTRFLAYEGCVQLCMQASMQGKEEAKKFIADGCRTLKSALDVDGIMLKANEAVPGGKDHKSSQVIAWNDTPANPTADEPWTVNCPPQCPPQPHSGPQSEATGPGWPMDDAPPRLRVKFQGFDPAKGTCFLRRITRRPTKRNPEATESICVSHEASGAYFQVALNSNRRPSHVSHDGEFITHGSLSRVVVQLFEDNICVATGRLPASPPGGFNPTEPHLQDGKRTFCFPFRKRKGWGKSKKRWQRNSTRSDSVPVELFHLRDGKRMGTTFISVEDFHDQNPVPTAPHRPVTPVEVTTPTPNVRVSPYMLYECLLNTAMKVGSCGSSKLVLEGPWKWLLEEFAQLYKIRSGYTLLAHLKWVLRPDVRTCTVDCLELVLQEYTTLIQQRDERGLCEHEMTELRQIGRECKELLGRVFENYFSLTKTRQSGMVEGTLLQPDGPPPVLQLAFLLLESWRPTGMEIAEQGQGSQGSSRGGGYAPNGYSQMHTPSQYRPGPGEEAGKLREYKEVEALAKTLRNNLECDMTIHLSNILPPCVNLPAVVAGVYCEGFTAKLRGLLSQIPPEHPAVEAVDMVVSVGRLQEYLVRHNLLPSLEADAYLDAIQLFGPCVLDWITAAEMQMVARCQALQAGSKNELCCWELPEGRSENPYALSPIIAEMIKVLRDQMAKFKHIVIYWPAMGPFLERAISSVLRAAVAAVSKQCGAPNFGSRSHGGPGLAAQEAMMLNSLQTLLEQVAEWEQTLTEWCAGNDVGASCLEFEVAMGDASMPPMVGAHFGQAVKELRTDFCETTIHICDRLAGIILSHPANLVADILHWSGVPEEPDVHEKMGSLMHTLEQAIQNLRPFLNSRVFVSVVRGLWDHVAQDLFKFVDNLSQRGGGRGAWRSRQNSVTMLEVVNTWFRDVLATCQQHGVTAKDLKLPTHAGRAEKLLSSKHDYYTVF
ncbi:hypothetical protein BSKO_11587 [Bryopsis sp. KO-2023]|nr:hypothetical protein BSKO_11587 [Bryopsis sp. KO-2023]